jgi:enoyl-CoA hydratase/carnithine racemase
MRPSRTAPTRPAAVEVRLSTVVSKFADYRTKYAALHMERGRDGILLLRLHTDGGPWQVGSDHADEHQLCDAFMDVANDPENRVVIFTGTGEAFCDRNSPGLAAAASEPRTWDTMFRNRRRLHLNLLEIEAPIVSAINGPALFHPELPLFGDVVLAADTTEFMDGHFHHGSVPGDGAHIMWTHLLGAIRGKYFLMTGQRIGTEDALRLGIVNEVLSPDELMKRAWEHAEYIAKRPTLSSRYTRKVINMELRRLFQEHLSHGLAVEGLALIELQGWRMGEGGTPPEFPTPARALESRFHPRYAGPDA